VGGTFVSVFAQAGIPLITLSAMRRKIDWRIEFDSHKGISDAGGTLRR
jgi:hypothetical protein